MCTARDEITALIYTYAERVDAGDFEGLADLLAHAELSFEGTDVVHEGRDAILRMYRSTVRLHDDGSPRSRHLTSNVIVEADEAAGTASARSYFAVLHATDGFPLQPIIAGRYHDRFVRQDGSWRFVARRMLPDLWGDLSTHLL